jgi:hypothetical protein
VHVEALDHPIPDGRFEVVVDAEDRPVPLTLTVENESARHTSRVEFSDWDAAITIAAPAEIDPTPWLDEEALAEARVGITPVRPTVLPDGIELQEIYPIPADEAAAMDEDCAQLSLTYGPPFDPEALDDPESFDDAMAWDDYLDVYLRPAACAQQADDTRSPPVASVPYRPGTRPACSRYSSATPSCRWTRATRARRWRRWSPRSGRSTSTPRLERLSALAADVGPVAIERGPSVVYGP